MPSIEVEVGACRDPSAAAQQEPPRLRSE